MTQKFRFPMYLLAAGATLAASVPSQAAPTAPRPDWVSRPGMPLSDLPNRSFLDQTDALENKFGTSVDPLLVDEALAAQMRQEYGDLTRDYEQRERFDQIDPRTDQPGFMERVKKFANYVLRRVFHAKVRETLKEAEKNSEEVRTFKAVNDQVEAVTKNGVNLEVDGEFEVGTRADLKSQKGSLWLKSSLVDGSFDVDLGEAFRSPEELNYRDPTQIEEKYRLTLSRSLPSLGLSSGVSYGVTTAMMTASVRKRLADNLDFEFATSHEVGRPTAGIGRAPQQSVKVSYGLSF